MKSFRFEAAQVWNSLPNEVRLAENYKQFRRLLQTWDGVNCRCTVALVDFWFFSLSLSEFLCSAFVLSVFFFKF